MDNTVFTLTANEDLKYHIMNDPVKYGFVLLRGETRRILSSVIPHLKVAKMKGKGKAQFSLVEEEQ